MPPIKMMMMILKNNHHQRAENSQPTVILWKTWKTTVARQSRERDRKNADRHFALIRAAYERATGNRWRKSDSEAYNENGLQKVPAEKIISNLEAVARRTP